jgi:hypothetical protein
MAVLTRRRNPDASQETWQVYYGDVRVGSIAIRSGNPADTDPWGGQLVADIRDEGNPLPGSHSPRKQSAIASQIIVRDQRAARHRNIESHEPLAPRRRASGFVSCNEFLQRSVPAHRLDIGIVPDRELRRLQGERTGASARASAAAAPMTALVRPAAGPWLAVAVQVAAARKVQRLAAT